jgi:predicted PolB exonuclease-like 3'-5' exonuclease
MTPVLCFDIETVPDVAGLRRLRPEWKDLDDTEVAAQAFAERREKVGSEFLQHHLHRIVAIGCAFRDDNGLRVRCLGEESDPETRLVQDFFRVIDRYTPQLVSWNGGGFDLPVLHYRALVHGVHAARYWDLGDDDRDFRFNNYLNRYHTRHLDLMDVLSMYQPRASAPLDDIAQLAGFPGKIGMDGAGVWDAFRAGQLGTIRRYCETDVVNTYLVFCRFQKMRGLMDEAAYHGEIRLVRETLESLGPDPWRRFLDAWPEA